MATAHATEHSIRPYRCAYHARSMMNRRYAFARALITAAVEHGRSDECVSNEATSLGICRHACPRYQQKRMSYDQTVCEIDSAATRNAPSESTVQGGHIWRTNRLKFSADPPSIKEVGETRLKLFNKVGRRYTIQPGLRNFTSSCVRTSLEPADARSRGALLRQLLGEGLLGAGGGARFPLRVVLLLLGLGLPGVRLGSARAGTGYERVSDVRDRARNASTMIRFW